MKLLEQSTVLIISDDAQFSGALTARWQAEQNSPGFTLMRGDLCDALDPETFDIAVVGAVRPEVLVSLARSLESMEKPVVVLAEKRLPATTLGTNAISVPWREEWLETLVLVASQVLQRHLAVEQARRIAEAHASAEREATLGRYILEMRHSLNNALTSILGNSELLLLEQQSLGITERSQVETIRDMSLRIHEVLRRFSSLDKEMNVVAKLTRRPRAASIGA
jgi:signal transduction histidine kinase